MGKVDATPVDHSLRMPGQHYDSEKAMAQLHAYLSHAQH